MVGNFQKREKKEENHASLKLDPERLKSTGGFISLSIIFLPDLLDWSQRKNVNYRTLTCIL